MVLSNDAAVDQVQQLKSLREDESERLDKIRSYATGNRDFEWLPSGVPQEVKTLAKIARVNVLRYIEQAPKQALYVDGYRARGAAGGPEVDEPVGDLEGAGWRSWQRNRMDSRQIGVHKAAIRYGIGYTLVLPGDTGAVIRGYSPRRLTAFYGSDDEWPDFALEQRRTRRGELWRLFDESHAYWVGSDDRGDLAFIDAEVHDVGHVPVVRYLSDDDLDDDLEGVIEPHMPLQDQIDVTTFSLLVAQHYGAHRQRYVIGWLAEDENERAKASASSLWSFEDDDVTVGEFAQTDLKGYIESREATLRHLATVSQTPVHELLGTMANLSAEALVAARDSHNRALEQYRTLFGESHEQTLELAGRIEGTTVDVGAWVRWRDMEARSLAAAADAFGKLVTQLGIPAEAFWDRVADVMGVSQQEVDEWRRIADSGDSLSNMAALLDRQMTGAAGDDG